VKLSYRKLTKSQPKQYEHQKPIEEIG